MERVTTSARVNYLSLSLPTRPVEKGCLHLTHPSAPWCRHKCEHAENRSLMCICRQLLRRALQKLHLSVSRGLLCCVSHAWRADEEDALCVYVFCMLFDPCRQESSESIEQEFILCACSRQWSLLVSKSKSTHLFNFIAYNHKSDVTFIEIAINI